MPEPVVASAYRSALEVISAAEPDVAAAIVGELESQRRQLKLIVTPMSNLIRGLTPTWLLTGPSLPTESSSHSSTRLGRLM